MQLIWSPYLPTIVVVSDPNKLNPFQIKLIESQYNLAGSIAYSVWRQLPTNIERAELESVALTGLVMAADRWPAYCAEHEYDPLAIEYFVPFAQRRIRGAILDSLRATDWARRSLRDGQKAIQALEPGLNDAQIAKRTGLTEQKVRDTKAGLENRPVSIDAGAFDHAETVDTEGTALERHMCRTVEGVVRGMDEVHQTVLALHYFCGWELQDIAKALDLTDSRASHIHTNAVLEVYAALREAATV
jgi:RNA polymerase sigma factor FliA